jgi:hypothetical protein
MNTGYLIYQAERPRSPAEQRQVDVAHAELARAVSRGWHALTAPLRARRRPGRRRPGRPAGHPAGYRTAPQAEGLAECPTGRAA